MASDPKETSPEPVPTQPAGEAPRERTAPHPKAAEGKKTDGKKGDGKAADGKKAAEGKAADGKKADDGKAAEGKKADDGKAAEGKKTDDGKAARAKPTRTVSTGIVHINATFNNTQVSITDTRGQVLAWSSSGRMGFRGTRKSTAYAATVVAQEAARQVASYRMQEVEVRVQGPGAGRESAVRALQSAGLNVTLIRDVTPIPHNGCRPRKRRRV